MTKLHPVLRQWLDTDFDRFAEMNADAEVMRFFPRPLDREESRQAFERFHTRINECGWGLWALEIEGAFAGFTGLAQPAFKANFTPCVEIGWRLRREYWGRGIAYIAALEAERFGFEELHLEELVSFTTALNARSRRLMERLGFSRNPADDFMHPALPDNHPLRPHVLYRKRNRSNRLTEC